MTFKIKTVIRPTVPEQTAVIKHPDVSCETNSIYWCQRCNFVSTPRQHLTFISLWDCPPFSFLLPFVSPASFLLLPPPSSSTPVVATVTSLSARAPHPSFGVPPLVSSVSPLSAAVFALSLFIYFSVFALIRLTGHTHTHTHPYLNSRPGGVVSGVQLTWGCGSIPSSGFRDAGLRVGADWTAGQMLIGVSSSN